MKKFLSVVLAAILVLSCASALADITIAVPSDPTNYGRALLLLQDKGLLKLDPNAGILATSKDVTENPLGLVFVETEAALIPNVREDVDYAIINNNYALAAELNPVTDALFMESANSPYSNVVCVKEGNENTDAAKALVAACESQQVADFITATYNGAAISVVAEPTDGYDPTVDYAALAGTTISVAATPVPHAEVLEVVKEVLAAKGVNLEIVVFDDYVMPNLSVEEGEIFANYFAHNPYQENFNAENGTHIVTISLVHVEPMGLYAGKQADLEALTIK